MSTGSGSGLEASTYKLLDYYDQSQILGRIEGVLWLIAALLAVIVVLLLLKMKKDATAQAAKKGGWQEELEKAYAAADYKTALNVLETTGLLNPGSASVTYWQGRCYFQLQDWEKSVAKFEELIRHEPIYRDSIRDYMAFIELNELVPGVEGYLQRKD